MKSILFISCLFLLPGFAHAEFRTTTEAVQKLKSYKPDFFAKIHDIEVSEEARGVKSRDSVANKKVVEFNLDLMAAVDVEELQGKWDLELLQEIFRLTCLSLDNDPSWIMARSLLQLYHKDPQAFLQAIKSLPAVDAKNLEKAVKAADLENREGNG